MLCVFDAESPVARAVPGRCMLHDPEHHAVRAVADGVDRELEPALSAERRPLFQRPLSAMSLGSPRVVRSESYGSKNSAVVEPSEPSANAFMDPSRIQAPPDPE